jgi:1,4-alpha-glucan branching enzyme
MFSATDRGPTHPGAMLMKTYIPHTLRLRLSGARHVALVGDFNNWHSNAQQLVQVAPDLWERIVDLSPGKYRYAFFVIDDLQASQGAVKSRVVGNGAVLWVPDDPANSVSVTSHPGLSLQRADHRRVA